MLSEREQRMSAVQRLAARSILMDVDAYKEWERFGTDLDPKGRPLTSRDPRLVPYLTAGERALYERLIAPAWTGPRRVEQERIPLHVALGHVQRLTRD